MKKVLIVEDDAVILYGLKAKFNSVGIQAIIADPESQIKDVMFQIRSERPDYIILDLLLPNFQGYDLLREIKSEIVGWRIPVFIFSNLGDQESRKRCDILGADYYFIKSDFNIDEFVDKVTKIIGNLEKRST